MMHQPDPNPLADTSRRRIERSETPARWLAALRLSRGAQHLGVIVFAAALLAGLPGESPASGPAQAYIGPGVGLALGGSLLTIFLAMVAALIAILLLPLKILISLIVWALSQMGIGRKPLRPNVKRVVVLGLDGLEPSLVEQFIEAGLLPNLAKLRDTGSYNRLATTWPPLSPVAWSSFSTGTNPGKHNIFDFIDRTPNYAPTMSSARVSETTASTSIFGVKFKRRKASVIGLRKSKPFWTVLGEHGVFSSIIRVPITYPPDKFKGVQLSAMCVPDLRGTLGMFTYYTETGNNEELAEGGEGGDKIIIRREGDAVVSALRGPANPKSGGPSSLSAPFRVTRGKSNGVAATLHVCGEEVPLHVGKFTPLIKVKFKAGVGQTVHGLCRFYLKRLDAPFEMYCSPVQIDPDKPVLPISHPVYFSSYLARRNGPYYTLGLAEDTGALDRDVLDEDAFLQHAYDIHAEREKMFFDAIDRVHRGAIVCVFDGSDRIQHMFWRFQDDQHPAATPAQREVHRHKIREMYQRMDDLVGRTMQRIGPGTALIVMSDHGFKSFRRGVDLNAWLRDNGYLAVKNDKDVAEGAWLKDIDWSRTRAFCLGLAGIFINQKDREGQGIVAPGAETDALVNEICGKLTGLKDPASGTIAIQEAIPRKQAYHGPYTQNAPDILVGYCEGFRVSWDAAIGKAGKHVFTDNLKAWSGDHCVHPSVAPGVLFSNCPLRNGSAPSIIDIGPTILDLLGVGTPGYMDGKSLLCKKTTADTRAPQPA